MAGKNTFCYPVHLIPLNVPNDNGDGFREKLNEIPYALYDVEQLSDGRKILINKPGGKRNFGRLSRNDFMVFIFNPINSELWLITHKEVYDDVEDKLENNLALGLRVVEAMEKVCNGEEPDEVLDEVETDTSMGLPLELILKVYKWIWGQEDVNYPTKQGRWLSMNAILELRDSYLEGMNHR